MQTAVLISMLYPTFFIMLGDLFKWIMKRRLPYSLTISNYEACKGGYQYPISIEVNRQVSKGEVSRSLSVMVRWYRKSPGRFFSLVGKSTIWSIPSLQSLYHDSLISSVTVSSDTVA